MIYIKAIHNNTTLSHGGWSGRIMVVAMHFDVRPFFVINAVRRVVVVVLPKVFTLLFGRRATACATSEKRGRRVKGQLQRTRRTAEQRDSCFIPLFLYLFRYLKSFEPRQSPEFFDTDKTTLYGLMVCWDRYRPIINIHSPRRYIIYI